MSSLPEMGGTHWRGLLPELVLFRFVVPRLQPGMVGPYPVRSVLFPSCLLLVGTVRSRFLGCNQQPTADGVQDPNRSPPCCVCFIGSPAPS
jgi:hypothetical protein